MTVCRTAIVLLVCTLCGPSLAGDFDPWTKSARYELEYRVDLAPLLSAEGEALRVWLPTPADNAHQKLLSKKIQSAWTYRETRDDHGNRLVYLEPSTQEGKGAEVVMRFIVERRPFRGVKPREARPGTPLDPQRYLSAQRLIPLDGKVRELGKIATRDLKTDGAKIRAIYDYVLRNMRYDKHGEGWGRGDVNWACTARYGNCTDFHSLFIGMARGVKIPARFLMGFPIPADKAEGAIKGYHCWAEAYDSEHGWLPLDASEAWKAKRPDDYFGRLPSDRVEFTVGRDLVLEPRQQGEPLNFFIYPYAEAGGKPVADVPWKLHFRRPKESE